MARRTNAPNFKRQSGGTLIRSGRFFGNAGQTRQPVARLHPHNMNRRFLIPNRFVKPLP